MADPAPPEADPVLLRGRRLRHPALPHHPHEGYRHQRYRRRPDLHHPPLLRLSCPASGRVLCRQAGQLYQVIT